MPVLAAIAGAFIAALKAFLPALVPWLLLMFFRLAIGLGVTFVSYKLLGVAVQEVLDRFADSYFSIPTDIQDILGLAGIPEALNIILGGFSFSFGIWASYRSLKFINK